MRPIPLARAIGERVRVLRTESGVSLDTVAAEARRLGLGWAKSSVAAIESGARAIAIEELLLLPLVLGRAEVWAYEYVAFTGPRAVERLRSGRHPVALADLLPDGDQVLALARGVHASARALRELFAARGWHEAMQATASVEDETETILLGEFPREWLLRLINMVRARHRARKPPSEWDDRRAEFFRDVGLEAADDATRKAAAVLHVPPLAVALAARALWFAWGLHGEREHRLAVALPGMERERTPPRKLQAFRGHVTRQLLDELRPLVKDISSRKGRRSDDRQTGGRRYTRGTSPRPPR